MDMIGHDHVGHLNVAIVSLYSCRGPTNVLGETLSLYLLRAVGDGTTKLHSENILHPPLDCTLPDDLEEADRIFAVITMNILYASLQWRGLNFFQFYAAVFEHYIFQHKMTMWRMGSLCGKRKSKTHGIHSDNRMLSAKYAHLNGIFLQNT